MQTATLVLVSVQNRSVAFTKLSENVYWYLILAFGHEVQYYASTHLSVFTPCRTDTFHVFPPSQSFQSFLASSFTLAASLSFSHSFVIKVVLHLNFSKPTQSYFLYLTQWHWFRSHLTLYLTCMFAPLMLSLPAGPVVYTQRALKLSKFYFGQVILGIKTDSRF